MKKILVVIISLLLISVVSTTLYLSDYYHALPSDMTQFDSSYSITIIEKGDLIVYSVEGSDTAIIFYPGGKVEDRAYTALAQEIAERGISVVICHMPCNLAVFKPNAADKAFIFDTVEHYYIAGHSLGGVMAASYAAKHADQLEGIILLASYSTTDLNETDLKTLSIYGSEDNVLNKDEYDKHYDNLSNLTEVVIEGGCHAYFGNYGEQKGDGNPSITPEKQREMTADAIANFIND